MHKTLCILLTLALLVTLLAGCSGGAPTVTTASTTSASTTTAADQATTATSATSAVSATTTAAPELVTHNLSMLARTTDKFEKREDQPAWKALEELMAAKNIEMEFELIASDQYYLVVQTRLAASMDLPDLICTGGRAAEGMTEEQSVQLGRQGVLRDYREILPYSDGTFESQVNKYFPLLWRVIEQDDGAIFYIYQTDTTLIDGETYETDPITKGIRYRRDWAEKLGIAEPTNAAEFADMVTAFREQDANGNGAEDEVMWMNLWHFNNGISNWFGLGIQYSVNDFFTGNKTLDGPNEVDSNWYRPGIQDYIRYMNNLVEKGVLNPENINASGATWTELETSNKISARYDYLTPTLPNIPDAPDAEYEILGALPAVDGITSLGLSQPVNQIGYTFCVTKACDDLPGVAAFLDVLWSDEAMLLTQYGIEDLSYEYDEQGHLVNLNDGMSNDDTFAQKRCAGRYIWQQVAFPRPFLQFKYTDITYSDSRLQTFYNRLASIAEYTNYTLVGYYYAPSTDAQTDWQTKNEVALETYEQELLTNLILGNWSLDDWDSYIATLKKLGLDECVEMYRDKSNRFFGK